MNTIFNVLEANLDENIILEQKSQQIYKYKKWIFWMILSIFGPGNFFHGTNILGSRGFEKFQFFEIFQNFEVCFFVDEELSKMVLQTLNGQLVVMILAILLVLMIRQMVKPIDSHSAFGMISHKVYQMVLFDTLQLYMKRRMPNIGKFFPRKFESIIMPRKNLN